MGGLFGALAGRKDFGSVSRPAPALLAALGGARSGSGTAVSDDTAMRVAAVYACVRILAEDVAKLPLQVWRDLPDGSRREATDHRLHAVLKRPNRHMTRYTLHMALMYGLGLRGNGIAVIARDGRGSPAGLVPVSPARVTLHEAADGSYFYGVGRSGPVQAGLLAGHGWMIPDYDVLHVRGLSTDGLVGLSPLTQLREAIGLAIAGEAHSAALMRNGARPGGVLKHPDKISDEAAQRLRGQWDETFGGQNAGRTALLEEGMSWEQLGMTSVDAQFLEQRRLSIEEIARGFRMPLHMLGVLAGATLNNIEFLSRSYYDQVLMPYLENIEAEYARAFALPDDVYVEFDVDRLLRADFRTRQEGRRAQLQSGVLSPNEWRRDEGRAPYAGGDVYARPLNTAWVDGAGQVVAVTPAGGKDTGGDTGGDTGAGAKEPKETDA